MSVKRGSSLRVWQGFGSIELKKESSEGVALEMLALFAPYLLKLLYVCQNKITVTISL